MKNYYEILQVNKNASPEIVTKVYHILAKKYHPDSTASNIKEAEEKFKEISEAYEILSNEEKRKKYDIALEEEKNSSVVSIEEYNSLLDRYEELETYLNSSNSNEINSYNDEYKIAKAKIEAEAYKDAVNKAYHDSYINNLKNMGYKIKYKKTFKEKVKNFFTLIITFTIIFVILYILWHIPSVQIKIKDTFFFF